MADSGSAGYSSWLALAAGKRNCNFGAVNAPLSCRAIPAGNDRLSKPAAAASCFVEIKTLFQGTRWVRNRFKSRTIEIQHPFIGLQLNAAWLKAESPPRNLPIIDSKSEWRCFWCELFVQIGIEFQTIDKQIQHIQRGGAL